MPRGSFSLCMKNNDTVRHNVYGFTPRGIS
jgi:hypothetical protein